MKTFTKTLLLILVQKSKYKLMSEFRLDYPGNYTIPSDHPLATSILTRQDTSNSQ